MTRFELFPSGSVPLGDGIPLEWGTTATREVDSSLDPWIRTMGVVSPQAIDLVRVMTAAFVADRLTSRGRLPRRLELTVHMVRPDLYSDESLDLSARLLGFLTGDDWRITSHPDSATPPDAAVNEESAVSRIALLSGGLDSFAHAASVCAAGDSGTTVFVSHQSNPMTIRAQNACVRYLKTLDADARFCGIRLRHETSKRELTNHARSILFIALGVAVADALGAHAVLVPENGFTSLNMPLSPNRQGRYSTRSTHPFTFYLVEQLVRSLGLEVEVANPHEWRTKGQMVRTAQLAGNGTFEAVAAQTISCGKLDGRHYLGGNANIGCGLCYACVVRRASFVSAGIEDRTPYLFDTLTGASRTDLISRRRHDISAVRHAIRAGVDEDELLSNAPFPPSYDIDRALDLWKSGLDELAGLELPMA